MHQQENEDQIIRDLLNEIPKVSAPSHFTDNVMDRISREETSTYLTESGWPRWQVLLTIIIGMSLAGTIIFYLDISWLSPFMKYFHPTNGQYNFEGFNTISEGFKLIGSSFAFLFSKYGIILGISSIIIIERLLHYRPWVKNKSFLF